MGSWRAPFGSPKWYPIVVWTTCTKRRGGTREASSQLEVSRTTPRTQPLTAEWAALAHRHRSEQVSALSERSRKWRHSALTTDGRPELLQQSEPFIEPTCAHATTVGARQSRRVRTSRFRTARARAHLSALNGSRGGEIARCFYHALREKRLPASLDCELQ